MVPVDQDKRQDAFYHTSGITIVGWKAENLICPVWGREGFPTFPSSTILNQATFRLALIRQYCSLRRKSEKETWERKGLLPSLPFMYHLGGGQCLGESSGRVGGCREDAPPQYSLADAHHLFSPLSLFLHSIISLHCKTDESSQCPRG